MARVDDDVLLDRDDDVVGDLEDDWIDEDDVLEEAGVTPVRAQASWFGASGAGTPSRSKEA